MPDIIDYQLLTSWSLFLTEENKKNKTHFTCWIMFIYRRLTSCFKSIFGNRIYVAQYDKTRLSSVAGFYANHILQVSKDIFRKIKNLEIFMQSVYVLIIVIYLVKKIGLVALIVF